VGLEVYQFAQVKENWKKMEGEVPEFTMPELDDVYILSYTSGTTGDSKGVKLTHRNVVVNACAAMLDQRMVVNNGGTMISYLPYTHSFEQCLMSVSLVQSCRIGYWQGEPLKLVEDCQMLKPEFFPSVPRLYNRIYGKIKAGFKDATGCKKWLVDKAVGTKTAAYERNGAVTHGCWDKLVFSKASALLGGRVKQMVTGSAPIDKAVIDFIKIVFSCPVSEGYGLTESAAASFITNTRDPTTGHVGGPCEGAKIRFKDLPDMNYMSTEKPYPRGEVCMKGPSIFSGYYKREDKTAEAFDEEGWFLTGDVAVVHPNGAIRIIDRSKNIFKLS